MDIHNINNNLIEHILDLLSFQKDGAPDADKNLSPYAPPDSLSDDSPNKIAAYELIRFIDEMPGGFLIYHANEEEDIIYANRALLRIFECDNMQDFKELTGNSFKGMVHHDDLEAVEQSIKEQIAGSRYDLDYVEYRIITYTGAVRWVEDYGHFVRSRYTGDVFYVFIGDATEKINRQTAEKNALLNEKLLNEKRLLKMLEEYDREQKVLNQEYLRRLEVIKALSVNYESILYVDLDADSVLPYRMSSRTEKQFNGQFHALGFCWFIKDYINTWVYPEDRDFLSEATSPEYICEKLSNAKTYYVNYRILKDEKVHYLQMRIVNVGNSRHISQIVMGYRKIDEEVLLEMEQKQVLEEALQNANLAIVAKNTFLSNMSHDMRTPLNAIFGFSALAKEHITEPELLHEYLDKIDISAGHLLKLIEEVLEIAWTESNDSHIMENECNIRTIVQNIYKSMISSAEEKNIVFSTDLSEVMHYDVYSDADKLLQLIGILVNNAIKYTHPGGHVDVIVSETKQLPDNYASYKFIVRDNGIGINKDFIANIFKPFEREKNTTFSGIHGSGLGLTIARNIAELMGGVIDVDSAVGRGSTFTFTLNMRIQNNPISVDDTTKDILIRLLNQKILLVEDNEINLEIETELFKGLGLIVETALNGKIAVEKIANSRPGEFSFILMDIQMPVMDGLHAAQAIRSLDNKNLADIPIIALSANAFESDKRASIESGIDAHLTKPVDIPLLLETISKVLQNHEIF